VVGWDGVRKAWQMRFGQFDRVTISMDDPHIRVNGYAAWAVGMEKVELLRKDGKTISFDAFVTNVFENQGGKPSSPTYFVRCRMRAFSGAEELSFSGTPRNDSRHCLESTSDTLGRSHR